MENAKTKAFDTGRKEGYDEGRYLANEDEKKDATLHLKKGRSWVERKILRIRERQRNGHTKMVGEKATKPDSMKGRKNRR